MKILIFTMGSRGDVQPYVELGAALQETGHKVTLCTGAGFDSMIEARGLISAPISINFREMIETPEAQEALNSFSGKIKAWRAFKPLIRQQHDDMWQIAQEAEPDLLVYHPKGFAAQHIAEVLEISAIATTLQPAFVPTAAFPQIFLPFDDLGGFGNRLSHQVIDRLTAWAQSNAIGKWRLEALGLTTPGPRDFFAGYSPNGTLLPRLHGYSPQVVAKPDDWPAREQVTGYWFTPPANDWNPPEALAQFLSAGPAPVYVGFGSMPAADAEKQTAIVTEALRQSGHRGILASGWGGLKAGTGSDSIYRLDSAPHSWLFPRCSAVVHHGGAGTTHEGLRWGRPSILCPLGMDQPFWGRRVQHLGVGPAPLPQKRLSAEKLARALEDAHRPAIISRAQEIGELLRAEQGTQQGAEIIGRSFT